MDNRTSSTLSTEPIWKSIIVKSMLPANLTCLHELSRNIWWDWNYEATELFEEIDDELWETTGRNPILLLERVSYTRLNELAKDEKFVKRLDAVYAKFKAYLGQPFAYSPSVAYFSMEYGLNNILKIYSGGLGILAGDYLKEASDSRVNMVAVGLLYRYGYFKQSLSINGEQQAIYEAQEFQNLPIDEVRTADGKPIFIPVNFPGRQVQLKVWRINVGRVALYLLDSDHALNNVEDRSLTHTLYGGDWENRMKQEIALGIGGMRMLNALGIESDIYHCNEGHAALLNLQRLIDYTDKGLNFDEALEVVRASSLFTTHTPVPAGHDKFDSAIVGKYLGHIPELLGISWDRFWNLGLENDGKFSMSVLAAYTSQEMNGVSWLHGEVTKGMFKHLWPGFTSDELHISYVTNGVHYGTWTASKMQRFLKKNLDNDLLSDVSNKEYWEKIQSVDDTIIWELRKDLKRDMFKYIVDRQVRNFHSSDDPSRAVNILENIKPEALTIGFARRFATYKRAHLLFSDLDRLSKIVNNPERPIQFVFAGKAHPADGGGQALIKNLVDISHRPEFLGKIVFVENYDIELAQHLVSGVDVWLNTPTRPLEASGTSGEKAELNGVLNFSVLDGWWYEGYKEGAGWHLSDKQTYSDNKYQDELDASIIYYVLENNIAPLYYDQKEGVPHGWIKYIKNSLCQIAPEFTTKRMITDYINRFYMPQSTRATTLKENDFKAARDLTVWKNKVKNIWDQICLVDVHMPDIAKEELGIGQIYPIEITLDKIDSDIELGLEIVFASGVDESDMKVVQTEPFTITKQEGSKVTYSTTVSLTYPGVFRFGLRITPSNPLLPHKQDFPLLKWI